MVGPERSLPHLLRLDGRVAVVTGGAGSLGTAMCEGLAEAGATVVVASRNLEKCEAAAARLTARGLRADAAPLDLSDPASITALRDAVLARHGRADILVNNAVYWSPQGSLPDVATAEDWDAALHQDGTGLHLITQAFAEAMKENRWGSIINISSIHGLRSPNWGTPPPSRPRTPSTYMFLKTGMIGFTRNIACYYAPWNIRANIISCGGYDGKNPTPEQRFYYNYNTMLGRMGDPRELKGPVLFLCSDAASYVTGAILPVDGGWIQW